MAPSTLALYARAMRFLFVMDPAEGMLPTKDTSFAFARGAQARGHSCLHCLVEDLSAEGHPDGTTTTTATVRPLQVSETAPHVTLGEFETVRLEAVDAIFVRKDPPFDTNYLHLTQVLDLVRDRTLVVNEPAALRTANEKLFALHFSQWMPRTLVTKDRNAHLAFLEEVGGKTVLKPLDGAGGVGVVMLTTGDKNVRALLDILTSEGKEQAMQQEFQPGVVDGDKRVLVVDGKPLGVIRRIPRADDIRANIHVGGKVEATELTEAEAALVADLAPTLSRLGLYFVGLDLIGDKLIEVNVTSPTGIQELGRLTGTRPEEDFIAWVEEKVAWLAESTTRPVSSGTAQ